VISQIYFWNKTLHVSDSSSDHHQELFLMCTQKWYMSYRLADSLRAVSGRNSQAVSKPVWHILLLCVHWKTPDDGQRNSPKHV